MKPMSDATPVPPDLLAHAAFVRRLARMLLADAHGADDLVQETWRRSLERPPEARGELRGWLARVARNLAFQRRRSDARRREREQQAARAEELPAAAAGLERTEVLQRVVDAVR